MCNPAKYHDPLDEVMLLHFATLRSPSDLLLQNEALVLVRLHIQVGRYEFDLTIAQFKSRDLEVSISTKEIPPFFDTGS